MYPSTILPRCVLPFRSQAKCLLAIWRHHGQSKRMHGMLCSKMSNNGWFVPVFHIETVTLSSFGRGGHAQIYILTTNTRRNSCDIRFHLEKVKVSSTAPGFVDCNARRWLFRPSRSSPAASPILLPCFTPVDPTHTAPRYTTPYSI